MSSRQPGSDPQALRAAPPLARSVHAIDPQTSADHSSERQVQTSQISTVTSDQQGAAVESSSSAQLKDSNLATVEVTEAPSLVGRGDQLLKITSAVSIRNGPSASADIIGTAYAGAPVRVASRDSGWTQIVDPSSAAGRISDGQLEARNIEADNFAVNGITQRVTPQEMGGRRSLRQSVD